MNKLLRDDIEYIVHCESDGTIIGPISKNHAHLSGVKNVLTHWVSRSMIYNPVLKKRGLQFRNPKRKKQSGGLRDMGVAGHNCYVQDGVSWRPLGHDENIVKEAKEEIGLDLEVVSSKEVLNEYLSADSYSVGYCLDEYLDTSSNNTQRVGLYMIFTTQEKFDFPDGEVSDFKWFDDNEMKELFKEEGTYCSHLIALYTVCKNFIISQ